MPFGQLIIFGQNASSIHLFLSTYRFWMALAGIVFLSWVLFTHVSFVHSNAKNNYHSFYRWIKMTNEMPSNGQMVAESEHQVVGLPPKENKRFWALEDKINSRYIRVMNASIVLSWLVFNVQLFLVNFSEVDLWLYILVQTLHMANGDFFVWNYFHSVYTLNVFFIECMWFLSKKFRHLSRQVQNLRATRTKLIHNKRLTKLIQDYNEVMAELMDINKFFKNFLGHNLLHFCGLSIFSTFISENILKSFKSFYE